MVLQRERNALEDRQFFLVLCGHQHGQSVRFDTNASGNEVVQILADYQDRGQSLLDVDPSIRGVADRLIGIGDGWLRLMQFDGLTDCRGTVTQYRRQCF